jgi:hypothetical protein
MIMRILRRALLAVLAAGLMVSVGAAAVSRASTHHASAPSTGGTCAAIDGNFDYLELTTRSATPNVLYESREAAALAANKCPPDTDSADPDDVPSTTTTIGGCGSGWCTRNSKGVFAKPGS